MLASQRLFFIYESVEPCGTLQTVRVTLRLEKGHPILEHRTYSFKVNAGEPYCSGGALLDKIKSTLLPMLTLVKESLNVGYCFTTRADPRPATFS